MTAGDYTVEFDIPRSNYEQWYNRTYQQSGGEKDQGYSPALSLKRHMIEQIEQALNEEVKKRQDDGGRLEGRKSTQEKEINTNMRIADLVFSYNNSALIHALRARGNFIALQKFDKAQA